MGGEVWLGFPDLRSGQNPWWNWYLTSVVNFGEVWARQIHSPNLHAGTPGIFSDLSTCVQMLKREWGAESNEKLLHLFIPRKTATFVPEFFSERPALEHNCDLGSFVCSERPALGQNTLIMTINTERFTTFATALDGNASAAPGS